MSKSNVLGRIPLTARIGLPLILIPLASLGAWASWYFTRSWEPLDIPISLARGHIRAEFTTNVESHYSIELNIDFDQRWGASACSSGPEHWETGVSLVKIAWYLSSGDRGGFNADRGHYVLDLDILEDASGLNRYGPRLWIFEDQGKLYRSRVPGVLAILTLLLTGPIGALMIILAAIHWRQEKLALFWKTYSLTQPGPALSRFPPVVGRPSAASHRTKSRVTAPFARLSQTSPVLVLTLFIVWTAVVVSTALEHIPPSGLPVRLIRPGVTAPRSAGIQPLRVGVRRDGRNPRPGLYVDWKLVAWEDFSALLKKEPAPRPPDWPVYVEGDSDLEWRQVAEVIDAIRGEHL